MANCVPATSRSAARVMPEPYRSVRAERGRTWPICRRGRAYTCWSIDIPFAHPRATLCHRIKTRSQLLRFTACCAGNDRGCSSACSSKPADAPPPTIAPAAGRRVPARHGAAAGVGATAGGPGAGRRVRSGHRVAGRARPRSRGQSAVTTFAASGTVAHRCHCPRTATAIAGDGDGAVYVSTRGGYFRVDVAAGTGDPVRRRRATGHRLHRDRPPRRRQARARQRRRRGVHPELRHHGRRPAEDLRPRGCPCRTRQYASWCWTAARPR